MREDVRKVVISIDNGNLVDLTITNDTTIGEGAFYNVPTLTTLKVDTITEIMDKAFMNTSALTTVSASALKIIGNDAFNSATSGDRKQRYWDNYAGNVNVVSDSVVVDNVHDGLVICNIIFLYFFFYVIN